MDEVLELSAGVVRTSRTMSDGRTIRYYDTAAQSRTVADQRPAEVQPSWQPSGAGHPWSYVSRYGRS